MGRLIELLRENPLAGLVALCEVGFWVLLASGLVTRYLLRLRRTGVVLLVCTPLLDVVLLTAPWRTCVAVRRRARCTGSARRIRGSASPSDTGSSAGPIGGWPIGSPAARAGQACVAACAIAAAVLGLMTLASGPGRTDALWTGWLPRLGLVTGIWLAVGPLWTTMSPREPAR
jgi:hypothetical protein